MSDDKSACAKCHHVHRVGNGPCGDDSGLCQCNAPAPAPSGVLTREEYRETLRKAEDAARDFGTLTNVNDHRHTVRLWNHDAALRAEVEELKRGDFADAVRRRDKAEAEVERLTREISDAWLMIENGWGDNIEPRAEWERRYRENFEAGGSGPLGMAIHAAGYKRDTKAEARADRAEAEIERAKALIRRMGVELCYANSGGEIPSGSAEGERLIHDAEQFIGRPVKHWAEASDLPPWEKKFVCGHEAKRDALLKALREIVGHAGSDIEVREIARAAIKEASHE